VKQPQHWCWLSLIVDHILSVILTCRKIVIDDGIYSSVPLLTSALTQASMTALQCWLDSLWYTVFRKKTPIHSFFHISMNYVSI